MSERTALKVAKKLYGPHAYGYIGEAYNMLRQQHSEIARLTSINSALTEKSNSYVIENARQAEEIERLTAEQKAAIADAVAAERNACAAVCENGSFLHDAAPTAIFGKECARAIRARSET